ncbi:hypothetical protein OAA99_00835 [Omnitrophica bacterium]|nr:hypothetical protein [Candidatus Omnitrophota bacterium]
MRKSFLIAILLIMVSVFVACESFAQEEYEGFLKRMMKRFKKEEKTTAPKREPVRPAKPAVEAVPKKAVTELTKDELIKDITERLNDNTEILDLVPSLKADKEKDGTPFYTYEVEKGIKTRLEELNISKLGNIYNKVMAEWNRLNAERAMEALEQTRAPQRIAAPPTMPPKAPTLPKLPQAPDAYTPPTVTTTPPPLHVPPQTPKTPILPPSPPPPQQRR